MYENIRVPPHPHPRPWDWNMHISCPLFASNGSPMYKSLTKTKKISELEAHETLKRVASANAIIKRYQSSSLTTLKRHAMVLSFFKC